MNCKGIKKKDAKAHTGHYRIDPSLLRTSLKMLSAEELEIAKNCAQIQLAASTTAELLAMRNYLGVNNIWSRHQIYYMENKFKGLNQSALSAKALISSFQQMKDVNYLYVAYQPSEGLMLMTGKF